jgi:acyl-CoA thioester hydrolase
MIQHEARLRARYAETDQMGVVYYANYLVWMEIGRAELCRTAGMRYKDLELEEGVRLAVIEARCRYHSPARYDEEIVVKTWIAESNPRMVEFGYEMRDGASGRKLATGETRHIFCGADMKPMRLPAKYWPLFGIAQRG